jgi:hypothetical protein
MGQNPLRVSLKISEEFSPVMSSTATMPKATPRPLLHRLFRAGLGRNLITVWVEEKARNSYGQVETETRIHLGRYVLLRWTRFYTPLIEGQ